ncbi:MAG TPA: NADH:ubiquinone reductase (Na(+)-transporting) subunit B [Flavilitoribacter sp.]|nr:NADH:ubiquinone reductase (Na(+)-transporting) subunit B [Flavilitoribacter sp.]
MKKSLLNFFKRIEPDKKKSPFLHTAYDAFFTFAFTPNTTTKGGVHIRDGMDLKRLMVQVVLALQLCYLYGTYNIGQQHFEALGMYGGFFEGFHLKLFHGLIKILPIFIVTNVVGLGIEFWYSAKRGHAVEEGFLVSGALIPLIMPPDIPLWMLGLSVAFAVILGKEAFGGTGMNIWNVALLSRVFIFFAYPTFISGDEVWVSDIHKIKDIGYQSVQYGWAHHFFDWIFSGFGWSTFGNGAQSVIDGYTGATPLALAAKGGWDNVLNVYSTHQMWWGDIPGSIGETSKPLIILGALYLVFTKIADWRIMVSMVLGCTFMGLIMNGMAPDQITADTENIFKFMAVPWYYHFYMGSFLFAMAFMATDPVTAASTRPGKWVYGFLIGAVGLIIRVWNPAYPEGWMLAILFMNTFSALIDNVVLNANMKRRQKRTAAVSS